jgi:hypothetical protein
MIDKLNKLKSAVMEAGATVKQLAMRKGALSDYLVVGGALLLGVALGSVL